MWDEGLIGWLVLASGYLLALGFFYWLGGFGRAANVIRQWGSSSVQRQDAQRRSSS